MADFGFVGSAYAAASPTQDAQALINWYTEVDPTKSEGERGVIALYPTPGLTTKVQPYNAQVRGFLVLPGGLILLAAIGNRLYSITRAYVATQVGTFATAFGRVYMASNGAQVYITDGVNRYSYVPATNTFATVTGGPFNGGGVCDEVDNFFIYSRPDSNQWGSSDVGDITSNPLNLGSIIGAAGNLVSLIADHRQILLLGENYSERWVNVNTFPFPFAVIAGSSIQHGLQAKNSVARLGEGVAFLARDTRGQATVVMWGATLPAPVRISTNAIENSIQSYAVTDDAIAYSYTQAGHEFYVLTFPTEDITWVFDLSTQMWHRRAWRDSMGLLHRHRSNCAAVFGDDIIVGDWENGKIYAYDQSNYTDAGDPILCLRRCKHLTNDLNRMFYSDLQIQFQPGVGLQSGQGSDPECILRLSRDGGFTWGNDMVLKLGRVGQYKRRAMRRRLGYARDMVFEIRMTDPVYRVVVSANVHASAGDN